MSTRSQNSIWKLLALVLVIAAIGLSVVGLFVYIISNVIGPRTHLCAPNAPEAKPIAEEKCPKVKIDRLPNKNMTANVGQYPTLEAARGDLPILSEYLNNCQDDFCHGLAKQVSVQPIEWPGGVTYHLVIKNIDEPTFYALCNYMWNGYPERWARETYHVCSDFNHRDDP